MRVEPNGSGNSHRFNQIEGGELGLKLPIMMANGSKSTTASESDAGIKIAAAAVDTQHNLKLLLLACAINK